MFFFSHLKVVHVFFLVGNSLCNNFYLNIKNQNSSKKHLLNSFCPMAPLAQFFFPAAGNFLEKFPNLSPSKNNGPSLIPSSYQSGMSLSLWGRLLELGTNWKRGAILENNTRWEALIRKRALIGSRVLNQNIT